ncbi:MAG: energy-coupling factor ABC transporter ATP-binding protein [Thermoproteota archaeon]
MVAAGLLKPTMGKVRIFGVDTFSDEFRRVRQRVGIVFQDPDDQLFCPTIWEDVIFGPKNIGLPDVEVVKRGRRALADVGLEGYEKREPYRLSVGEKKKAAIATALALEPELLLLDEPTANLEPAAKRELIALLKRIYETRRVTMMISAHDVDIIPYIVSRVYVLNDGRILAEGDYLSIFSNFKLLDSCRLEPPLIARFFGELEKFGLKIDRIPMTLEEGLERIKLLGYFKEDDLK